MIGNLSIKQPENEKMRDYYDNEAWEKLQDKIRKYEEKVTEVPVIISGQELTTNHEVTNYSPSNSKPITKVYKAGAKEIKHAIDAALESKAEWSGLDPKTRILLFKDLEHVLAEEDRKDDIIAATIVECGYNAPEAEGGRAEIMDFVRFNSYWYHSILQEKPTDGPGETNFYVHRPLKGFTTAITPFNFPIAIGYNLPTVMALTGNTVVWKPSSDAPLVSLLLMKALKDAGFPDGVINMVPASGPEFGEQVLKHPELTAVNFTGSYDTAWQIKQLVEGSGPRRHFPRIVAETGGKDFMWVDKSAAPWLDDIATQIIAGAYGRSGQKCSATSRAYVPKPLLADLKDCLESELKSFRTGDPTKEKVSMGPVINRAAFDKIINYIEIAKKDKDCEIVCGGTYDDTMGFFIDPTVIITKNKRHKLMQEEIFGPVLTIYAFDKLDEADTLKALTENGYKLTGSLYCKDPAKLEILFPILVHEAGNFYVNRKTTGATVAQQPFGGDGMSGTNRKAGSKDYIREFVSPSSVCWRHTPSR